MLLLRNKLILDLEKNRLIEKKKEEKERERKEREVESRRLEAIEHQYRTQMRLMQERSEGAGRKGFNSTDHKVIIEEL